MPQGTERPPADRPEPRGRDGGAETTTSSPVRWWRRLLALLGPLIVAVGGAVIGWQLAPATTVTVGPFELKTRVVVNQDYPAQLDLPPVGVVGFQTHEGPLKVAVSMESVNPDGAAALVSDEAAYQALLEQTPGQLRGAVQRAAATSIGYSVLGAGLAGLLVYRRPRVGLASAAVPATAAVVSVGMVLATLDFGGLNQPHFTGLLSRAPYVAAESRNTLTRLQAYRAGVQDMVRAVTVLYSTSERLPAAPAPETVTVLHVSDIHLNPQGFDLTVALARQFDVDAVVDTGDITTWGTPAEAAAFSQIGALDVPYVYVRGNHDSEQTAAAVASFPNAVVLDATGATVAGLRIVGVGDLTFTPDGTPQDPEATRVAAQLLAYTAQADAAEHGAPPDIALIHNPADLDPVHGSTPLVLSGHLHRPGDEVDEATGTRVLVEGSTGGAAVTSGVLDRLEAGEPLPLTATLLYFGAPGTEQEGRLLAYDRVSVGGLGLASASIERTTLPLPAAPDGATEAPAADAASTEGGATTTDSP